MAIDGLTKTNVQLTIMELYSRLLFRDKLNRSYFGPLTATEGADPVMGRDNPDDTPGMTWYQKFELGTVPGDQIHFEVSDELLGPGTTSGDLVSNEEKWNYSRFTVTVSKLRHAFAIEDDAENFSMFDLMRKGRGKLARWLARKLDDDKFSIILTNATILWAGDATGYDDLNADDTYGAPEIDKMKVHLQDTGAIPVQIAPASGVESIAEFFVLCIDHIAEHFLRLDSTFMQSIREALPAGWNHPLFTGAWGLYNGVIIRPMTQAMAGREGTAIRPETSVRTEASATDTSLDVGNSVNTVADFTRHFYLHTDAKYYLWLGTQATWVTATGKTGNTFTGIPAASTGSITATAAVGTRVLESGNFTAAEAAHPVGRSIMFGGDVGMTGWGMLPRPIMEEEDYGDRKGFGVKLWKGEKLIEDSAGGYPNMVQLVHHVLKPV